MKEIQELIKTYDEYIALYDKDTAPYYSIGFVHGITSDPKDIEKGKELRQKIKELKEKLTPTNSGR